MTLVKDDDDAGDQTYLTSASSSNSAYSRSRSSVPDSSVRQVIIDLKMELAEALAKVDDLTLANRLLAQERDEAREQVRCLRQPQCTMSTGTAGTCISAVSQSDDWLDIVTAMDRSPPPRSPPPPPPHRRASHSGGFIHSNRGRCSPLATNQSVMSIFQSSLSSLHDETIYAPETTTAECDQPVLSAKELCRAHGTTGSTGSLRTSLRRLSNEIHRRYDEISNLSSETDTRPTCTTSERPIQDLHLRGRTSSIIATVNQLNRQEEEEEEVAHFPAEEEEIERNGETYSDYSTKTNFAGGNTNIRSKPRRWKKPLVSDLQIARARIASEDEVIEPRALVPSVEEFELY